MRVLVYETLKDMVNGHNELQIVDYSEITESQVGGWVVSCKSTVYVFPSSVYIIVQGEDDEPN